MSIQKWLVFFRYKIEPCLLMKISEGRTVIFLVYLGDVIPMEDRKENLHSDFRCWKRILYQIYRINDWLDWSVSLKKSKCMATISVAD